MDRVVFPAFTFVVVVFVVVLVVVLVATMALFVSMLSVPFSHSHAVMLMRLDLVVFFG